MKNRSTALALLLLAGVAMADESVKVPMNFVDGHGKGATAGHVVVTATKYGLVFTPALSGLPPGLHGFHVHQNPSCTTQQKDGKPVPGGAAGGHLDPDNTGKHDSPWGDGHLGDLPPLFVDSHGLATQPVLAPRLDMAALTGRSLMIHAGGDNHSDHPAPLGGGGGRIVCGVIG